MQVHPVQVVRHGQAVWENPTAEAIRVAECLCHHCDNLRPGTPEHCSIAQQFYEICKAHGTAFVLSRCDSWKEKPGQAYVPPKNGPAFDFLDVDALRRPGVARLLIPPCNLQLPGFPSKIPYQEPPVIQ